MLSNEKMSQLTDDIYDAALDGGQWIHVLEQLAQSFGASSAHLSEEDFAMTQGRLVSYGTDPAYAKSYADYYVSRNVLWKEMVRRSLYEVMTNRIVMPIEDLRRTEFYNDFLRPQDGEEILVGVALRQSDAAVNLTLWRPERLGAWEAKHMEAIAALTPHLRRALQVSRYLGDLKVVGELASEALHQFDQGIVVVGERTKVLFANRAAEALFAAGDGLSVELQRLRAARAVDTAVLHELIGNAAEKGIGGSLVISREERPSLIANVVPVRAGRDRHNVAQPSAIILIRDLERPTKLSLTAFARHFGLTPAQTALAQEMIKADGVAAAAKRLGISYATARTHLVQIFQKTGTCRQSELVRLAMQWDEGPAMGASDSLPPRN